MLLIASLGLHNRKKLVATACRCERVYKRTGKQSETFCERGATTECARKVERSENFLSEAKFGATKNANAYLRKFLY